MSFDLKLTGGDITIGPSGDLDIVTDTPKLTQDVIKFVTTTLGSNKFQPSVGSLISKRLIGKTLDPKSTNSVLQSSVQEALVTLQKLQQQQAQVQALSPAETLVAINSVKVFRDSTDPRLLNVLISIMAADGTLIPETVTVRVA